MFILRLGGPVPEIITSLDKNKSPHTPSSFPSPMLMVIIFLNIFLYIISLHRLGLIKVPTLHWLDYCQGVLTGLPSSRSVYCIPPCSLLPDWLHPNSTLWNFCNGFLPPVAQNPNFFTRYSKLIGSSFYPPLSFTFYLSATWNYLVLAVLQYYIISWRLCPYGSQTLG